VLPIVSQGVTPPVRDYNIVCGHSSLVLMIAGATCFILYGALPLLLHLVRYDLSHCNGIVNSQQHSSNAMVWPSISCLVILGLSTRHACMTLVSRLLISVSITMLFFLNCTQSSSSSRSLRFPCWVASQILLWLPCQSYVIPSSWYLRVVITVGAITCGFLLVFPSKISISTPFRTFGIISALRFLHMIL